MNRYWSVTIIGLFFVCSDAVYGATVPEKIPPKTQTVRSEAWYQEQAKLWGQLAKTNPEKAQNWLNFYTASKYAKAPDLQLNNIVERMSQHITGSFEYHFIKGWFLGSNGGEELLRAHQIAPNNPLIYGQLMMYYERQGEQNQLRLFCNKMLQSNLVSTELLNYSYNVLMSTDEQGILITEGENTTWSLWILQHSLEVRKDVMVLNLDLLLNKDYRESIVAAKQIDLPELDDSSAGTLQIKKYLCSALPEANPGRQFYFALTLPKARIGSLQSKLYVVGLASQHSKNGIDNMKLLKRNIEQRFLLDYLVVDFNGVPEYASGRLLRTNYLVPLLMLHDYYMSNNQEVPWNKLNGLVDKLAHESKQQEIVDNYITRNSKSTPAFKVDPNAIDIKKLDNSLKLIKGNLYAQDLEVTNGQYNKFLDYLKQGKHHELYEICRVDLSNFEEPALSLMKAYHFPRELLAGKPAPKKKNSFFEYPVINISYEAALNYCRWLTDQYNSVPNRKHQKVKFRLPERKEWQIAALGDPDFQSWDLKENTVEAFTRVEGSKKRPKKRYALKDFEVKYPWWKLDFEMRDRISNQFDCYLANVKIPDDTEIKCPPNPIGGDGFLMTSKCGAYFANGMKLYDVVGNVAEMLNEKGKACGGSWNHLPDECTISSIHEYQGPSTSVGFRVFMEVLEP